MGIQELQLRAHSMDLKEQGNSISKAQIIRAFQKQRGEVPCFSTDKRYTCNDSCEWRSDCLKLRAVWLR